MKLPLFIFAFFFFASMYGQKNLLQKKQDSIYIDILLSRVSGLDSIDSLKNDMYEALKMAKKHQFIYQQGQLHKMLGILYASDYKKIDSSNYHFNTSLHFLRQSGDSLASFDHANNISVNYVHLRDMPTALEYAIKALKFSKKLNLNEDLKKDRKGAAHLLLGSIYAEMKLKDSAIFNLKKSRSYFKDISSPQEFVASSNLGELFLKSHDYENSKIYVQEALDGYKTHDLIDGIVYGLNLFGDLQFAMRNYPEAIAYYNAALKKSDHTNMSQYRLLAYRGLIKVFLTQKKNDSTDLYLKKSFALLDTIEAPKEKVEILKLKANFLEGNGRSEEALSYLKWSIQLEDSITKKENLPKVATILVEHEKKDGLQELKNIKQISSKKNYWIFTVIVLLIALSLLTYFLLKKYRNKLNVSNKRKKRLETTLQLEKENNEYIRRKLVSAYANLALKTDLLSQVNQLLNQIKNQPKRNHNKEILDTQNQIKFQNHINNLWREFFAHFEEVHPNFLDQLKSKYGITQNDLKICAFLRMNLTNKDICQLMNVNPNTIRVNIHRIKKKLDVPTEISVAEFLSPK
ncbi:tetratricopeptide repeat protein [Aquimarina mytili]|uniref:HTH luxR-type domain-containing protein n=1 Tax=Aquimarina mytili TaxID=874423 RepID=A0A936ZRL5_9FLAO|nr:hypothetical protein [Aquimarina mytili]MBL0683032.1 hypothetical protein [Aquimarina mytili]